MSNKLNTETYHSRAQAEVEAELGGRWARPTPMLSGSVPEQPAPSPWSHEPVGLEPPLGYSVDAMEPVGEVHEIEASLRQQEQRSKDEHE